MDGFSIYALFGLDEAPREVLGVGKSGRGSVAVPASVQQVVLFTRGRWGSCTCVTAELRDAEKNPLLSAKLTPLNKSLCWEYWEDGVWSSGATVTVKVGQGGMSKDGVSDAELTVSRKEVTPQGSVGPRVAREAHGKRKRKQEVQEDDGPGQENLCPNGAASENTPHRRGSKTLRGSLFPQGDENSGPGASARTPQTQKPKGRQGKTPTQTAPLDSPSGRWGHTLCPIDPQTAILIGGQGSRMHFCKDPMWKLCTEDLSWVPAETLAEGPTPEARIGHTATYDPESRRIFVFGGSKNKKWFNDMHILDTQSWRWSMVEAQGKVPPLAYHSCSLFRGELFVFGGVFPCPNPEPDGCSDSIYIFSPEMAIWYQPIVTGERPAPRSGHSACVIQGKIFIFGGWDTPVCFNDMNMLDLGLMEFSTVKTYGTPPSPRSWHGCALLSDSRFLVHGGYNGNNALNDTFIFNTDTSSWTTVVHSRLSSVPRAGHSIITMSTSSLEGPVAEQDQDSECTPQTLLIFGGGDNEGSFFSDLITMPLEELRD
ncbi:kelch repeat-containing protein [Denticeps clupeoides]|uniref:Kelch repeat-containing protein n=1 Tax=Denticeps clupeoides TaxID=299321 RepID=A0AAY4BS04_9TELE|nr:rab9 effector protein with kelch motifs-like [Denticeps clupeoides]